MPLQPNPTPLNDVIRPANPLAVENDTVNGLAGNDKIDGGLGNDVLDGGEGDDLLKGGGGDDKLDTTAGGAVGVDRLEGGAGNDFYYVNDTRDKVIETLSLAKGGGYDTVWTEVDFVMPANVEEVVVLPGFSDPDCISVKGNALDNKITGNECDNLIDGGKGADWLIGGEGEDTYVINSLSDKVEENGASFKDRIVSSVVFTQVVDNVENYTFNVRTPLTFTGDDMANEVIGGSAVDLLIGQGGDDRLDGGMSFDFLVGGMGNDTYVFDHASDLAFEKPGEGEDTIASSVAVDLSRHANVENATLVGKKALSAAGTDGVNILIGNDASNRLDGRGGADVMRGNGGNDTYIVDDAGDKVEDVADMPKLKGGLDLVLASVDFDLAAAAYVENLTLTGVSNLIGKGSSLNNLILGNVGDNRLYGLDGADKLLGGAGNDSLYGGKGNDALTGGEGDDKYFIEVDAPGIDKIVETAKGGTDTVVSELDFSLAKIANVENLTLAGMALNGTGNALDNVIIGNALGNVLDGGKGNDTLIGGEGDDIYIIDSAGDVVSETGQSDGADRVQLAAGAAVTILVDAAKFAGIEIFQYLGGKSWSFAGDAGANHVIGGSGADRLSGGAGNDVLDGGKGNDNLEGGDGEDTYLIDSMGDAVDDKGAIAAETDVVVASIDLTIGGNFKGVELFRLGGNAALNANGGNDGDHIIGNVAANGINGGGGGDRLEGDGGDDLLTGGKGDDELFGGAGHDTAIFNGKFVDFLLADNGDGRLKVTDGKAQGQGNDEGVDRLFGVEALQFTDGLKRLINNIADEDAAADSLSAADAQIGDSVHIDVDATSDLLGLGDVLSYALEDDLFAIDASSGVVTVKSSLASQSGAHVISVQVTSLFGATAFQDFVITYI